MANESIMKADRFEAESLELESFSLIKFVLELDPMKSKWV